MVVLPEGGRHIARITCRRCGRTAEVDPVVLKELHALPALNVAPAKQKFRSDGSVRPLQAKLALKTRGRLSVGQNMSDQVLTSQRTRQFRIVLRSDTCVAGKNNALIDIDGVKISTHHERTEAGGPPTAPAALVFDVPAPAKNLKEAVAFAEYLSATLADWLAFAHNGYIEAPFMWIAYSYSSDPSEWQELIQNRFKEHPAPIQRVYKALRREFVIDFVRLAFARLKDNERLDRALKCYVLALSHWRVSEHILAAEYLYIAVENLTKSARAAYEAQGAVRVAEVTGSRFDADAMRGTIFKDAEDIYDGLRRLSNGFEHGIRAIPELRREAFRVLDRAAPLIRKWIVERIVEDPTLRALLLSEPYRIPQMRDEFFFLGHAQFRSTLQHPAKAGRICPSLHVSPRFKVDQQGAILDLELDVTPEVAEGTEVRDVRGEIQQPMRTFEEFDRVYPIYRNT